MAFKPSKEEQKWAKQLEEDLKKKLIESLTQEEMEELRELHWKKCPKDGIDLIQIEIEGTDVIINKCIMCGGIWLDRIDIDRLLQFTKNNHSLAKVISKALGVETSII